MGQVSEPFVSEILDACALGQGQRLLDVGTGTGLVAAAAAARGEPGLAVGLDVSLAMLAHARARGAPLGVRLVAGDAEALPCRDASFDAVVGHFVLVFCDRPESALVEIHRVLRAGGRVALTVLARPEATAYGPVLQVLGRRMRRARALLRRLCSLGSSVRLAALLTTAGFREVHIQPVHRPVRWASFAEYWRVIEAGGGLAGREYRTLPASARPAVRKEVERAVAGRRDGRGLAWQVEALLGTARR